MKSHFQLEIDLLAVLFQDWAICFNKKKLARPIFIETSSGYMGYSAQHI